MSSAQVESSVTTHAHQKGTHWLAVSMIAITACVFGAGFVTMQTVLRGGLSVGAAISIRFCLASLATAVMMLFYRVKFDRRSVIDGTLIGIVLVTIFWLQTDGLRFTTTSKSAFITSLYVPFTPMLALVMGKRVRLHHAIGALLATIGLLALVHVPGGVLSGWNRGDFETLAASVLCAVHITLTAYFSRRSTAWVLTFMQLAVTGVVSLVITLLLPGNQGFHGVAEAFTRTPVIAAMAFMVIFNSVFAFWAQSSMQAHLTSTEAAVIFSLEPVVAGLIGVFWVGETLTAMQLAGAALIVVAMLAAEILPRILYRDPVVIAEAESEALE